MPPWIQQVAEQRLPDVVKGVEWWFSLLDKKGRTRWGTRSRVLIYKLFLWFAIFSYLIKIYFPNGFADKLVNKDSLDKILKAEVFVNSNGQLRAAHLILGYTPILSSFQAPKCVIRARDPRLYLVNMDLMPSLLIGFAQVFHKDYPRQALCRGCCKYGERICMGIPTSRNLW